MGPTMKRFLLTTAFPDLRRTNGANRAVASKHTIGAAAPGGALLLRRRNMRRWGKVVLAAAAATALACRWPPRQSAKSCVCSIIQRLQCRLPDGRVDLVSGRRARLA